MRSTILTVARRPGFRSSGARFKLSEPVLCAGQKLTELEIPPLDAAMRRIARPIVADLELGHASQSAIVASVVQALAWILSKNYRGISLWLIEESVKSQDLKALMTLLKNALPARRCA